MPGETRDIRITIVQKADTTPNPENPKPVVDPKATEVTESKGLSVSMSVLANQVFNSAVRMARETATYEIDRYFDTTNDYVGKRNLNEAIQAINMGTGLAMATVAGFKTGGVIGAGITSGLYLANQALNIGLRLESQRLEIERNDSQLAFSRLRAGYSLVSDSRGENL